MWGWKLKEKHKLGSQLERFIGEKLHDNDCEVLMVAMPAWNTLSEATFLESHLQVLEPDYVIWEVCQNDVDDLFGAFPPGVLNPSFSPQNPVTSPFTSLARRCEWPGPISMFWDSTCPMPSILGRWEKSLLRYNLFREVQDSGVVLSVGISPEYLAILSIGLSSPFLGCLIRLCL